MKSKVKIRLIKETDAQPALDIFRYYVDNTNISFEYDPPTLEEYIQRIKTNTEKYPWLVCLNNDKLIGFAYGSTHRYRTAYQWSPESTIYLAPNFHSKGIGRILYETLFEVMKLQGYFNVFAGVALPNEKSIRLHRAMGFDDIGIFKNVGYKHSSWIHTHWFQLLLNEHKLNPSTPTKLDTVILTKEFSEIMDSANNKLNLYDSGTFL